MSRPLLFLTIIAGSYAMVSSVMAVLAAVAWRCGVAERGRAAARMRANRLLLLRLGPSVCALLLTVGFVLPAWYTFEPPGGREHAGPLLAALTGMGLLLASGGLACALRSYVVTRRLERTWLVGGRAMAWPAPDAVPGFIVEACAPLVALVGVWRPKLLADQSVLDACNTRELASIIRHELAHLRARDNLKRALLACAPDALRWTRVHGAIAEAWHEAAEDAADDVATGGEPLARVELASLLVKIAGLAPQRVGHAASVSPFVSIDQLDRRVKRLLRDDLEPRPSAWPVTGRAVAVAGLAVAAACGLTPAFLRTLHIGVEWIVAFGR